VAARGIPTSFYLHHKAAAEHAVDEVEAANAQLRVSSNLVLGDIRQRARSMVASLFEVRDELWEVAEPWPAWLIGVLVTAVALAAWLLPGARRRRVAVSSGSGAGR
jgi:hypothetical protein